MAESFTKKQFAKLTLLALAILSGSTFLNTTVTMSLVGGGVSVSADTSATTTVDYNSKAAEVMSKYNDTHEDVAQIDDVKFDDPESAVVGKWVNLTTVTGVAKDGNQSVDYKVNNVFVRKDQSTGQLISAYIGGKTSITLTSRGSNNSIWVEVGDGTTFKKIKEISTASAISQPTGNYVNQSDKDNYNNQQARIASGELVFAHTQDTPQTFVLPDTFSQTDSVLRVAYISNNAGGKATGGTAVYPTPKIQLRTAPAVQQEISDALKQGAESRQAKLDGTKKLEDYRTKLKNSVDKDNTLGKGDKDTKKANIDSIINQAEKDIAEKDNAKDVNDFVESARMLIKWTDFMHRPLYNYLKT
ncbi:hypothetical protein, partial [Fructobacillus parabroussonetiae]